MSVLTYYFKMKKDFSIIILASFFLVYKSYILVSVYLKEERKVLNESCENVLFALM